MRTSGCFCTPSSNKADKTGTVFDAKRAYQNYPTVLEMVNSVSDGGTVIAFGDNQSPLYNAEDRPPTLCEYFYVILSDGLRKNVVAFGFTGQKIYMRRVWSKVWSTDWTQAATCYGPDIEWKELPMTDKFIYWNDDKDKGLRLQYRKGYDAIYVAGTIKPVEGASLAYEELIATLPTGYRPSRLWYQLCALSGGGSFCRVRVGRGGDIVISGYDPDGANAIKNSIEIYLTIPL